MCTLSVSDVIYHKFSHGAAFCTLNGKNVNVMLELHIKNNDNSNMTLTFFELSLFFICNSNMTLTFFPLSVQKAAPCENL